LLKFPLKCETCFIDVNEELHSQNSLECVTMQVNIMFKYVCKALLAILTNDRYECDKIANLSKEIIECETKYCLSNLCAFETKNNQNIYYQNQSNKCPEFVSQLNKIDLLCHGNAYISNNKFTKITDDAWDTQVRINKELTKGVHQFEVKLEDLKFDDGGSIFVGFKRWEDTGTSYKPADFVGYYF